MDYEELLTMAISQDVAVAEKVNACAVWLASNPNHAMVRPVAIMKSNFEDSNQKQQIIDQKQQIIDQKQQTLDQKLDQRSLKRLKLNGYHVLMDSTLSDPHFPLSHESAEIVSAGCDTMQLDQKFPGLWDAPYVQDERKCDHEIDAQFQVLNLITSVLKGMRLDHQIEVCQNRTLAGVKCDLLLVYKPGRLPFAVIEVKKPGNSELGRRLVWQGNPQKGGNRVAGEVYDQLKAIQLFGFSSVTGMITTFIQWRVVGLLDELDKEAQSEENFSVDCSLALETFQDFLKSQKKRATDARQGHSPLEKKIDFARIKENRKNSCSDKRRIWGGDIVPSFGPEISYEDFAPVVEKSGETIVAQVIFFVVHAVSNLQKLLQREPTVALSSNIVPINESMPCRILSNPQYKAEKSRSKTNGFAFGTVRLKQLNLNAFCDENSCKCLHVIRHLGVGQFGNVCLAVSKEGAHCCAVKFYHNPEWRKRLASEEKKNWDDLYGNEKNLPETYIFDTGGGECLIMPYLHPIGSERHRKQLIADGSIAKLLRKIANRGYLHNDINWRHFRLFKTTSHRPSAKCTSHVEDQEEVYLIDLGEGSLERLEATDENKKVELWIKSSIDKLKLAIKEEGAHTTPTKAN